MTKEATMTHEVTFQGFPQEGVQFLRDLVDNNNKEWFSANKPTYKEKVQEPALDLVTALGERLQAEFPPVSYDARSNGGSLMRIYRDTRFSKDKSPYKTNVAMMFVPGGYKRMEAPGFGLQITPELVEMMAGSFGFSKEHMETFREAVADDKKGEALVAAIEQVRSAGDYDISGEQLKRVPRGYDADHPRADWLKYKGLYISAPKVSLEVAHTPQLVDEVMAHFRNMAPVHQWLMDTFGIS